MKTQKLYVSIVTVEGAGHFPVDMLRYDSCVPDTGEDAAKVDNANYQRQRTVKLRRYSVNPGKPTVDRWKSFSWTVTDVVDASDR